MQVAIQRQRLGHGPAHHSDTAGDVVEAAVGHARDHPVEHRALDPVEPAVEPRRPAGHRHVAPALERLEQRADPLGLHLEVGGQGEDHVPGAALDPEPEGGGLAEGSGEAEHPHRLELGQAGQLGRRSEAAVHHEEELVGEAAGLELAGERLVDRLEIVGPFHDGDDDRDQPGPGARGTLGGGDDRLHQALCPHVNEPPRRSEYRWRSRARCSRPPPPPGRA